MSKAELAPDQVDEFGDEAEILQELLDRTAYGVSRWADMRSEGELNMIALSIKGPWPEQEWDRRQAAKIPHGHTDIISWANDRVVNQWRMNPRGVTVNPTGGDANEKTAELRESRLREIAYSSQAKGARICCFQNMVDRGYGAWEVYAEYESPSSSRQRLCVGRIPNPNSVIVDPDTTKADRSDKKWAIKMGQTMSEKAFKRKYPKAQDISSFPAEVLGLAGQYIKDAGDGRTVTPAEYFRIIEKADTVLTLENGEDVLKGKLKEGETLGEQVFRNGQWFGIKKQRETQIPQVQSFVTNGVQILSKAVLPISMIPILFGVAKEKYVNDVLTIEAQTSKMREPQLNFDVARAAQMQAINMVPKSKWVVSDDQISGYEKIWEKAHQDPSAYLPVHEYDRNGRPMAHPERTDFEPPIQGFEMAANAFIRDSQNAVGMTSTERINSVAKSGVAQERINEAGDISAFHITDNMIMLVEFEGRIENEWLAAIEDSARPVGLRKPDGKYSVFDLQPTKDEEGNVQSPYGSPEDHSVTIGTGPDYQSQHDKKTAAIEKMVENPEFVANPISPLLVHEMELGPGGDKIEKILLSVQPPAVQAAYAEGEEGQEPIPPQAMQALQQQGQQMQLDAQIIKQLQQKLEDAENELKAQAAKAQADYTIAQEKNSVEMQKAQLQSDTQIELQRMKDAADLAKIQFDVELERIALERERIRGSIALESQARSQAHESAEGQANREAAARQQVEEMG